MKQQWWIGLSLGLIAAVVSGQLACTSKSTETSSTVSPSPTVSPLAAVAGSQAPGSAGAPASSAAAIPDSKPAAPGSGSGAASATAIPDKPQPPRTFTLASGRSISIYTASTLSTKSNRSGEVFTASLAQPIVDGDWVIAKQGARVDGVIVKSDPGGRVKGRASMAVRLKRLELADGRGVELSTSSYGVQARGTKKKEALKIGIGAGVGALIGGLAGGGKGAAIGAGAGGGAGRGPVVAARGDAGGSRSE